MSPKYSDGSIRQKGNTYEYRFYHNGERYSVSADSKQGCYNKRTDVIAGKIIKKILTYGNWLDDWAVNFKQPKYTPESYYSLLIYINKHIKPVLGDIPLNKLTTLQIQNFLIKIDTDSNRRKIKSVISDSLRKAHGTQLIKHTPFSAVEIPKGKKAKTRNPLQPSQQIWLCDRVKFSRDYQFYYFCCCTGLRPGEAMGVRIANIDFQRRVIIVNHQIKPNNNPTDELKSDAAYRDVPFLPELFKVVTIDFTREYLFFPDITRVSVSSSFKRLKKMTPELKNVVLYSFRHTFVSCCYHIGIKDKQIQLWAGHEKVETTLNTYTHILSNEDTPILQYLRRLAKSLGLFSGKIKKSPISSPIPRKETEK